jgi:hypothetical protein
MFASIAFPNTLSTSVMQTFLILKELLAYISQVNISMQTMKYSVKKAIKQKNFKIDLEIKHELAKFKPV